MQMTPVASSTIDSIGYDAETQTLYVKFKSGQTYQYFDVPPTEYQALSGSPSKGKHLNAKIKGEYRTVKVGA